jgi:type VI secretion system secreted protein VgrG
VQDYTFKLSGDYARLGHVCQYRESRLAFLWRRMEREGMYTYFEHGDGRERLIITDDRSCHEALSGAPVRYFRVSGAGARGVRGLRSFTCKHASIAGTVRVMDYDYLRPTLDVTGEARASDRPEVVNLHGESFATPEEGSRLARVRAEELRARQVVFRGTGNVPVLRPGYTFELEDHPRSDGAYLATELVHQGSALGGLAEARELLGLVDDADQVYRVDVVAIPAHVQFRPERRTPMPRIYGLEGAVIDGEADHDYAQLDEHGRYFVKLKIDESPAKDGKASMRIRMMQPHGGNPEGFHFPLRKGTEVLLAFEGGDPDRPVIAGVVPNAFTPSSVTATNSTKNVIHTGGGNRIQIEDLDGKQHVRISSPHLGSFLHLGAPNGSHNWIGSTKGNSYAITGQDAETGVGGTRLTVIGDGHGYYTGTQNADPGDEAMDPALMQEALEIANAKLEKAPKNADGTSATGPDGSPLLEVGSGTSGGVDVKDKTQDHSSDVTVSAGSGTTGSGKVELQAVAPFNLTLNPADMIADPDNRDAYRQGSDLKFVGGDNVTKVTNDKLVAVQGNSVTHVHGQSLSFVGTGASPNGWTAPTPPAEITDAAPLPFGTPIQQSTVYGGTISKVFAPKHVRQGAAFPRLPPSPVPTDGSEAQWSILVGDQLGWIDGNVSSTVTGNKASTVDGDVTATIDGTKTTTVNGGMRVTVSAPEPVGTWTESNPTQPDAHTAQSTVLYGNQLSWVGGDQDVQIQGQKTSTVYHGQQSTVHEGQISTVTPYHITMDVLKLALYANQLSFGATKSSYSLFSSTQSLLLIKNHNHEIKTTEDMIGMSIMTIFL